MSGSGHLPLSRRGLVLLGGCALLLVAVAAVGAGGSGRGGTAYPPLSVHSTGPDGAGALALWLARLGYRAEPLEFRPFRLSGQTRLLFVLAPTGQPTVSEIDAVAAWVRSGGTLVVASETPSPLLARFGADVVAAPLLAEAVPLQPFGGAPTPSRVAVATGARLALHDAGWVPLLGTPGADEPVAAVASVGEGRVIALASDRLLSNAGLAQDGNWTVPLLAVAGLPGDSLAVFDEYHHGLTEYGTFTARLVREPWGWAVLGATGVVVLYLLSAGRRFGRPVPATPTGGRREPAEYVTMLAALLHEGGQREWLGREFAAQSRRDLVARAPTRTGPTRADGRAAQLLDPALARLEAAATLDEATMLALMREVDDVPRRLDGRRHRDGDGSRRERR